MADRFLPLSSYRLPDSQTVAEMPSYTYRLDLRDRRVKGFVDDQQAMEQAIGKIIDTWRNTMDIYTSAYGFDAHGLQGKNRGYVLSQIERRVREALLMDRRILRVQNFQFYEAEEKDAVLVTFLVATRFGDWLVEQMEVRIK